MDRAYWLKQTDKPLFPELEWSRPEHKLLAGKLLIIGGHAAGFAAPAGAYGEAITAGIGSVRVLLPRSLERSVGKLFPAAEFVPSTPSGSFSTHALAEVLDAAAWANGVLLPGDITRNSETTVLLESFLEKYEGRVTLTKDAADLLVQQPLALAHRPDTLLVLAMGQLRRLGTATRFPRAFTSDMGLVQLVDSLHELSKRIAPMIIVKHQGQYVAAVSGQVSTTRSAADRAVWRLHAATAASVWWLQNPFRPFEALTAALYST